MGTGLKSCFSEEEVIVNQGTILGSQIGKWITLAVLVAVLAALFTASVVRAQEDSTTIEYAENGTDPVATLTATDPEMRYDRVVCWRRLTGQISTSTLS